MANRWFYYRDCSRILAVFCTLSIILCGFPANWGNGNLLFAAERSDYPAAQYKIVSLGHISAEQGMKFLSDAGVGTVSKLPSPDTLLITAQPDDLTKALVILRLIDSKDLFTLRKICPASEAMYLPSNNRIAVEAGDISIGTFSNPPDDSYEAKAIIDIHDDSAIAIAPVWKMEAIVSSIEKLSEMAGRKVAQMPPVAAEKFEPPAPKPEGRLPIERAKPRVEEPAVFAEKPSEASTAVRSYQPQTIVDANEMLELDLPEKLNIIDLLALVGEYLNLDYMYDDKKLVGQEVSLRLRGPIKVKDLYPLLESVLKFRGFVMARKGNLVTIVPNNEALTIDPTLLDDLSGKVQLGDVIVTRVFNLQYIEAESAKNLLSGMKLGADINTSAAEAGKLIVTDYAQRMERIEELLAMIDIAGEPREFRFRQLRYTMAKTLAPKVKNLAEQLGTVSISVAAQPTKPTPPTRGRTPARRTTPTPTPKTTKPTVYLDADERTNRILMIGMFEQLDVVESLIDSLDVEQQDLRTLKLYDIQHVDADEAKNKLQELGIIGSSGRTTTRTRTTRTTATKAGAAKAPPTSTTSTAAQTEPLTEEPQVVVIESTNSLLVNATAEQHTQIAMILSYVDSQTLEQAIPYEIYSLENQDPEELSETLNKLIQETVRDKEGKIEKVIKKEEDIIIIPDKNTFSIIVYASKKNQEWISKLIKNLDKRRPQVLIDTTLVQIEETDAFNYDLQLVSKFPQLAPGDTMDKLGALLSPEGVGFPLQRVTEATSILGEGNPAQGFYADRHIQALLSLMQTKGYGRVLAKPKILVNDNEEGIIKTENILYAMRSSQTGAAESGFVSKTYSVESYPSGIELNIKPHISEGDLLRLEIEMKRSSQPPPAGAIGEEDPPPNKTENTINTIVTVPDDSTIILGGILTLHQTKENWKVPLLGDIPIVGGAFRKIDNSSRQSKLYIFVKAHILRPSNNQPGLPDLERISEKNKIAFEKHEEEFQKYHDWPGAKPKPMDPLKVLDAR